MANRRYFNFFFIYLFCFCMMNFLYFFESDYNTNLFCGNRGLNVRASQIPA